MDVSPYSDDLRERVAGVVADGVTVREVAELFRVSPASVVKWSQRMRATGSAAAKPMGGVRRAVLAGSREWLLARITEASDLTLQAIRTEVVQRGVEVSLWAVWKLFKSEGIMFKKSLLPSEQLRARIARRREIWRRLQKSCARHNIWFAYRLCCRFPTSDGLPVNGQHHPRRAAGRVRESSRHAVPKHRTHRAGHLAPEGGRCPGRGPRCRLPELGPRHRLVARGPRQYWLAVGLPPRLPRHWLGLRSARLL